MAGTWFGRMKLGRNQTAPPLALAQAPGAVTASDSNVTLVPLPNTRDVYRIGFGVDMVGLVSSLTGGTSKQSTTGTSAKSKTPTPNPEPDAAPQNKQPAKPENTAQNPSQNAGGHAN